MDVNAVDTRGSGAAAAVGQPDDEGSKGQADDECAA